MLRLLLASAQQSWLLALTFALLVHALLALPPLVVASAPSWQLETFIDVERWYAFVVMPSLPRQSVVGLRFRPWSLRSQERSKSADEALVHLKRGTTPMGAVQLRYSGFGLRVGYLLGGAVHGVSRRDTL